MQIQISWLLKKPADLDLNCLQRQGISAFSRTRVKRVKIRVKFVLKLFRGNSGYIDLHRRAGRIDEAEKNEARNPIPIPSGLSCCF